MIKIKKIEGTDIFEFSIDGEIDKESVKDFYKLLELKAEQHQKMKLLGTINEFPSFKDFKAFSSTLKMKVKAIHNIGKYAIISDKEWIETLLPAGDFLTPGIPMKHFDLDEREEAITWLRKDDVKTYSEDEYLSKMNIENIKGTNIYSFTLDGKIDEGGMIALYNILKNKNRKGKISLLATYKDFDGFNSFKAFTEGLKVDFGAIGNIEKYAVVTDKKWAHKLVKIESKVLPGITMKGFALDEADKALEWLKS
ncbi:SpoIIAA family protein [Marixanthomonas ophiurae]|uniref:STAS/SEC14 domain-containing protein n=1 Tax=Marixanthomonas ophiurae TaxID=387659 RepID=A0A3E1QDJ1_9FLAO|nr:STAS/SEC14 domain-containing protein [Marixanthomonas ophiurae]RFN60229.1 STAS/SEC14 domain-containing protein [Marixanthomonas ophiurae]